MYVSHQMSIDNSIHDPVFILDPAVTSSLSSQVIRDNKPRVAFRFNDRKNLLLFMSSVRITLTVSKATAMMLCL